MKPFSKWTISEVEKEFQVDLQKQNNLLDAWLECEDSLTESKAETLSWLQIS